MMPWGLYKEMETLKEEKLDLESESERIHNSIMQRLKKINKFATSVIETLETESKKRDVKA